MQVWTDAWHTADPETFKAVYTINGLIFPPNKPAVQGNSNILAFMENGLGKVQVIFEPSSLILADKLAFEFGVFKDIALDSEKIIGKGSYAVTWILERESWKVLSHSWSMPI